MRREIASWKADGWAPTSSDAEQLLAAYGAAKAGTPAAFVKEMLADARREIGGDAIAEAFRLIEAELGARKEK